MSSRALAQSAETVVGLSYDVPPGCPPREQFQSAVTARTPQVRWSGPDARRQLGLVVTQDASGFHGSLAVWTDKGPRAERTLDHQACAALVDALALVAAMDLELALARGAGAGTAPTRIEQRGSERPVASPGRNTRATRERSQGRDHGFTELVAIVGGLEWAPTPALLPTGGLHWGMRQRGGKLDFGVSAHYGQTGSLRYEGGDVRFRWVATRVFGCPLGAERVPFALFACANAEVGLLRAEPKRAVGSTPRNGFWFAPGLGVLASLSEPGVAVEAFVGITRPLVRDRFFFAPASLSGEDEIVHRAPALGPIAELRLGVPF